MGWAAALLCLGFAIAGALLLNVRIRDFDEGVYWQSIRAMARGESLFSSVFASQPPGFYNLLLPLYLIGHSLASLRLTVLVVGVLGLAATCLATRLLAGAVAALIALVLVASSALYFHQSAIVQADGPSVALSAVAVCLALLAVRRGGTSAVVLALAAGMAVAAAIGIKFLSIVTAVPIAMVFLDRRPGGWRLLGAATVGGLAAGLVVFLPAIGSPNAAFSQLIVGHFRASAAIKQASPANLNLIFLHREQPLEAIALIGAIVALIRRDRTVVMPLAWALTSLVAVMAYHPLFAHHLVMLSVPFAMVAAVGLRPLPALPQEGREIDRVGEGRGVPGAVVAALVLATAAAGAGAIVGEMQLSMVPDRHDAEMTAAVKAVSRPGEFWISDNPYAVAAANHDLPGPMVDTASQRVLAGLLTVDDLEAARVHYHVRWLLEDSFRLERVPNYATWLFEHFHAVESLGGRAVIYQAN